MRLKVSVVVFKSDSALFAATLESLATAVSFACDRLPELSVGLCIVENEHVQQRNLKQVATIFGGSLDSAFNSVELKVAGTNLGYGRGHNLAMDAEGSDFHLVLNPDVAVSEWAIYEGLTYLLANSQVALLAPKVSGREGEDLFPCKRYPTLLDLALRGFAPEWLKRWFTPRLSRYEMRELASVTEPVTGVDIVSGCYMLMRSDAFRAVDGFDERFFLYFEDFDLSLRIRSEGDVVYLPAMAVAHYGGNAAKKGVRHIALFAHSALKFYQRHGWRWI